MSWYMDLYLEQVEKLMSVNLEDPRVFLQLEKENRELIKNHNDNLDKPSIAHEQPTWCTMNKASSKTALCMGAWARRVNAELVHALDSIIPGGESMDWSHKFPGAVGYNIKEKTISVAITERDFLASKTQQMKMGKYLRRLDRYTDTEINKYANEFKSYLTRLENVELSLAHGSEAIMDVYRRGPNSCMSGDAWREGENPIAVYGTPDIACAYVKVDAKIKARVMINLIEDTYSVIYGNEALIEPLLEKAGYSPGNLDGCRILRLEFSSDVFIMPYIDEAEGVSCHDDDYFIVGGYDYRCIETNGLTSEGMECPHCGDHFNPEYDGVWVEPADTSYCSESCAEEDGYVLAVDGGGYSSYEWVSEDDAYFCETDSNHYLNCESLVLIDDEWYREDDESVVYSEDQGEYIFRYDAVYIDDIDSWVDDDREHEFEEEDDDEDEDPNEGVYNIQLEFSSIKSATA